jgi:hypothetical protein
LRRAFNDIRWLSSIVTGMDQNRRAKADPPRGARPSPATISQATYWRRRVLVLAVGIGLLTTISWAASGMLASRSTASQAPHPGGAKTAGSTPAQVSGDGAPASPSPSPRSSSAPSPDRTAAQPRASSRALACAPGAVTLRVSSPQYWYQPGTTPRFTVHAVSRETQPCRFNMGTKFVSVVVAAAGRRIWSSADCVSGESNMLVIAKGTPAVLRLSWDRKTSAPGCTGTAHLARPGEYQVTAVAGHLRSAAVNVVLGATGASGP